MWSQVCEIQEPLTTKTLLSCINILFGLYQGSNQDTTSYLGITQNLILRFNSGGKDFSTTLINMITVQHLDTSLYQKVMDGYKVGSINFFSKDLEAIDM